MRFIRSAATTLTLAGKMAFAGIATLAAFTVPALTTPAFAQALPVDVSPSTATPGESVTVSVTCPPGSLSATLDGTTLGLGQQIQMTGSMPGANQFATTLQLPASIVPGQYSPSVDCNPSGPSGPANITVTPSAPAVAQVSPQVAAPGNNVNIVVVCGAGATSAMFYGPTIGSPQIPMTPTSPRHFSARVSLPTDISPGTYSPSITCNNQNNKVTNNVTTFHGYGMCSYSNFTNNVSESEAFESPTSAGVQFTDSCTRFLNGQGGINSVIDGTGAPVNATNAGPSDVLNFPALAGG